VSKTRRVPQRTRAIRRLAKLRETFGPDAAAERERLLRAYGRASCRSGKELRSLHETLCFARAYPDNQAVLDLVQDLLDRWERRADVHALGKAVRDLGMAGVPNAYPFFWPTARWLAERWPGALQVDWDNLEDADGVASLLQLLMPRAESPALEELPLTARQWVRHLKRDDEGDGTFLVRRFAEANMDERWREEVFDSLDVPFVLAPARGTPSRTTSFIAGLPLCWQTHARSTVRPHLKREIERPPKRMRHVNRNHGAELVNAARVAMLTRERDLEQIAYASADDAWILEDEDGLCFVALGKVPERRFVLEATYVYLVVKNGVPVGYLQGSGLGGWAEINYNIFPPWRGRDAAALYARSLAVIHAFQHVSTFIVDPYQLGADNEEAIASGAWWFYYKLGFRSRGREARALALREQDRVTKRVCYRSSPSTLRELALSPMVLQLYDRPRFPYGGVGPVGLHASHCLSKRGGGLRSEGLASTSEEAAALLGGTRDAREGLRGHERDAFTEWSAIVVSLPGVSHWGPAQRRGLLDVIKARGGRTERAYVEALQHAPWVVDALAALAKGKRPVS
jgi:hypothetical protein